MMWNEVMARVSAEIMLDPVLLAIYGDTLIMSGTQPFQVPSLEWTLISDIEEELWAPVMIQFDLWHNDAAKNRQGEFRFRSLYHKDLPIVLNSDLMMWAQWSDGGMLSTPARSGIFGRALRFKFTPLRRQYALPGVAVV